MKSTILPVLVLSGIDPIEFPREKNERRVLDLPGRSELRAEAHRRNVRRTLDRWERTRERFGRILNWNKR